MKADRVLVVQCGNSWQATMRNGAWSAVGEFRSTFDEAVNSGHEAFAKMVSERIARKEAKVIPAPKPFDPLEDI